MSLNTQRLPRNFSLHAVGLIMMCLFANHINAQNPYKPDRPRIVVTADPELDDNNSLIRFLLYSFLNGPMVIMNKVKRV